MNILISIIVFQVIWFFAAIMAGKGLPLYSVSAIGVSLVGHWLCSKNKKNSALFYLSAAGLGFIADTCLIQIGVMTMTSRVKDVSPLFMVGMWCHFVSTFDYSLAWVHKHKKIAVLLGGIAGPLAYWSGEKLGALQLNESLGYSLGWIAFMWIVTMPTLMYMHKRIVKI
ncbi:MAG: DUF2878 domain-containing protein [bacterium]